MLVRLKWLSLMPMLEAQVAWDRRPRGCPICGMTIFHPCLLRTRPNPIPWSVNTTKTVSAVLWDTLCKVLKRSRLILLAQYSYRKRTRILLSQPAFLQNSLLLTLFLNKISPVIVSWLIQVEADLLCLARFKLVSRLIKSPLASRLKSAGQKNKCLRLQLSRLGQQSRPLTLTC